MSVNYLKVLWGYQIITTLSRNVSAQVRGPPTNNVAEFEAALAAIQKAKLIGNLSENYKLAIQLIMF